MAKSKDKPKVETPENLDEVAVLIRDLGRLRRDLDQIDADLSDKVDELKAAAAEKAKPLEAELAAKLDSVAKFAAANRKELTDNGKRRTVVLPAGTISWRRNPPKVNIRNTEEVLANVKRLGLGEKFIRTVDELNKDAMRDDAAVAETIEGVSISQSEDLVIKPTEVSLEVTKRVRLKQPADTRKRQGKKK